MVKVVPFGNGDSVQVVLMFDSSHSLFPPKRMAIHRDLRNTRAALSTLHRYLPSFVYVH